MIEEKASLSQKQDQIVNKERLAVCLILEVLQRGLASRVREWGVKSSPTPIWPISKSPPKSISTSFLLGINLDTQHAFSILDKGPGANEPQVSYFIRTIQRLRPNYNNGLYVVWSLLSTQVWEFLQLA